MNSNELDALMEQSTRQFNELKVEEGTVKNRLEQIDTAMKQLQGEYEAYNTLKTTLVAREATPDPASIVDPKPKATHAAK